MPADRSRLLLAAAVGALALVASAPAAASPHGAAPRAAVSVHGSPYGRILADGRGFALYAFTRDARGRSRCSGPCSKAWPPFRVSAVPRAGAGTATSALGVTRRADGTLQATYAGRPLYYYVGDRRPGQVLCQDVAEFGGRWLVLRASGSLVR